MPGNFTKRWDGPQLQAATMACGICSGTPTVGVTMFAENGEPFAHGHLELEAALSFLAEYTEAVRKLANQLGVGPAFQ